MGNILVIGSSNTDLIASVDQFPGAGETVTGTSFRQAMGGKGANQAIAALRAGGDVRFVTALGNDPNGRNALTYYREQGLDVSGSRLVDGAATGTAMILVNKAGENCIVVTPGANHHLLHDNIEKVEREISNASYLVLQMEIPLPSVRRACELAANHKVRVLLNVAPAMKIHPDLIGMADLLVVNGPEIEKITGKRISEAGEEGIIDSLRELGARCVILTLGSRGSFTKSGTITNFVPAYPVSAVDSTAAGDTFCGALVARLSKGIELAEAIRFATAAAAICVTRWGAQPSIPTEKEVNQFLDSRAK